jgi:ABC-type sugar transport system permease subunit
MPASDPKTRPPRPSRRGAFWFLLPNTLGFLIFTLVPVLGALVLSFFSWDPVEGWHGLRWAGGGNYVEILSFHRTDTGAVAANDPLLWYYLYNTAFLMLGVPIGMVLSLFTALLLEAARDRLLARAVLHPHHLLFGRRRGAVEVDLPARRPAQQPPGAVQRTRPQLAR